MTRVLLVLCLVGLPSWGKAKDVHTLLAEANQAWKQREYVSCQTILARITDAYGQRAMVVYGPKFGVVYYKKGLAELRLGDVAKRRGDQQEARKWYACARESFRICYEDFPNYHDGVN